MSLSQLATLPLWGLGLLSACGSAETKVTPGEWVSTAPAWYGDADLCEIKNHLKSYTYTLGEWVDFDLRDSSDTGHSEQQQDNGLPSAAAVAAGKEDLWSYCQRRWEGPKFECTGAIELLHHEDWLETGVPIVCPDGTAKEFNTRSEGFILSSDEILVNSEIAVSCSIEEVYLADEEGSSSCSSAYSTRLHLQTAAN